MSAQPPRKGVPPVRPAGPGKPAQRPQVRPAGSPPPATARPARPTREAPPGESAVAVYARWILRGVVFGALVVAALKIVPWYIRGTKARPKWEEAVTATETGDYKKALALFQEARAVAPDYQEGFLGMGGRTMAQMYAEEAGKCYSSMAVQAEEKGEWTEVAAIWKKMIEDENLPDAQKNKQGEGDNAYYNAAKAYENAGNRDAARKYAKLAVEKTAAGGARDLAQKLVERLDKKQ